LLSLKHSSKRFLLQQEGHILSLPAVTKVRGEREDLSEEAVVGNEVAIKVCGKLGQTRTNG
jgi:hypothetical protein